MAVLKDEDRDSMNILPLAILPVKTPGLKRARMIKNSRLSSVIEMFDGEGTGSGQVEVDGLPQEFGWPEKPVHPDLVLLQKVSTLRSYDVYSLRILLREHGIKVNDVSTLRLSKKKTAELTEYMTAFTHPLITEIFGGDDLSITDFNDILKLFHDPDIRQARAKLNAMAEKLKVEVQDIPKFLEDIGDIFLSLSYYRQALENVEPVIGEFHESVEELQGHFQLQTNRNLMQTCGEMQSTIGQAVSGVDQRFKDFDSETKDLWSDISAERLQEVQQLTQDCHTSLSGVLCGLSVKMTAWHDRFPNMESGGPLKRAEFIMTEMRTGLEQIAFEAEDLPEPQGSSDSYDPGVAAPQGQTVNWT